MSLERTKDKILSEEMIDIVELDMLMQEEAAAKEETDVAAESEKKAAGENEIDSDSDKKEDSEKENGLDKEADADKKTESEKKEDSDKKEDSEKDSDKKSGSEKENGLDKETDADKKTESEEKEDSGKKKDSEKDPNKKEKDSDKKEESDDKKDFSEFEHDVIVTTGVKKKSGKKGAVIAAVLLLVLLAGVYFTGFWYFSSHFYKDVTVNGLDVSLMDKPTAKQRLDNFYKAYVLTLDTVDGEQVSINSKDIDMKITLRDEFEQRFSEQKPYEWFVDIWNHHDYVIPADVKWNQDKLDNIYDKMEILHSDKIVPPEDAYIASNGNSFAIVEEVMGNELDEAIFRQKVEKCLSDIRPELNLKDAACYHIPKLYKDSEKLNDELGGVGDYAKAVITIQMDDLTIEPDIKVLESVLDVNGSSVSVSYDKVSAYVNQLASQYNTYGTRRTFKSSFVDKEFQIEGKYFGYELDKDKTCAALYDAFNAKAPAVVDAVFLHKGKTLVGDNDIGDTYIEADLTRQRVVAYKNGRKFDEADCVSGNVSQGHGTCLGLYAIQNKQSPATLRGDMIPKQKKVVKIDEAGNPYEAVETTMEYDYESFVVYWMPFNGGYGLHDADDWRSRYGGSIYYYSGSHGCINLPRTFAKKLYENFDVGTPVLVYYEGDEKDPPISQ